MIGIDGGPSRLQLDSDNPWPGLDAFEEASRDYFHGREAEGEDLVRRVADFSLTVLFGKSGLGKTSLLKAGLFPRLRSRNFLPVYARLDVRADAPPLAEQLKDTLRGALERDAVDAPGMSAGESLWEYLHRERLELWSSANHLLTPVLVLDQFEEVFTLGERARSQVDRFQLDLGDLAENRIPSGLHADEHGPLDLRRMRYKVLLSLREDFVPHLEGWRPSVPSLGRARLRLLPLRPDQAFAAVYQSASHLLDQEVAQRIVRFVAAEEETAPGAGEGKAGEVEPALLSLFCRGLNERRKRAGLARIDAGLLEGAQQGIVSEYYASCVEGLPDRVGRFIEAELITEKGYRNSFARDDAVPAHLTEEELAGLIRRRLLRIEERYGTQRIELTHDVLTRAVREHRDSRRAQAEKDELARRAEAERAALAEKGRAREQELDQQRRAAEEKQLKVEAAAAKRFRALTRWLAVALVFAALGGMVATALAFHANRLAKEAMAAEQAARAARGDAERQRETAVKRLQHKLDGIAMKKAVGEGDRQRIEQFLSPGSPFVNETICFTARADERPSVGGQSRFLFSLYPLTETLPDGGKGIGLITYWMDHPSFNNSLMSAGPERKFKATYSGWGCLNRVIALIDYLDPDQSPQIAQFDMCDAVRGQTGCPKRQAR